MREYINVLKNCILFKGIEEENIIPLLSCINGKKKVFKNGQTIYYEGDKITEIGIVLDGSIELIRYDYNGNKSIVDGGGISEIFGESFACLEKNIPISIETKEDSVICFVDVRRIIKTCSNSCNFHNSLIHNLLESLAVKNMILNQKIEVTSKRTTRDKLLNYLNL